MKLTELAVGAALIAGAAGTAWTALDIPALTADATAVTTRVSCRTVDAAIAAYTADHGLSPTEISQAEPYVAGDITAYRISAGVAAGPGCTDPN